MQSKVMKVTVKALQRKPMASWRTVTSKQSNHIKDQVEVWVGSQIVVRLETIGAAKNGTFSFIEVVTLNFH